MSERAKYYKPKDRSYWIVYLYWDGRKLTRSHYDQHFKLETESMAERIAGAINADIDEKGLDGFDPRLWFSADKELQFSFAVDKWFKAKTYAPSTKPDVERYLEQAKVHFGTMNIKSIRKAHLKNFIATMTDLAPGSQNTIKGYIQGALNEICDDWHLMRIPWPTISVPHREPIWLTREWQDAIIDQLKSHDRPIFEFMRAYGCRPSEACALMWDAVEWDAGTITIKRTFSGRKLRPTTKTGYFRKVPMTPEIKDLLRPLRGIGETWVFRNRLGRHYVRQDLWRKFNAARDKAECPIKASLKDAFRHSKASQLLAASHGIEQVRQFLGHRNIKTTEVYAHMDVSKMRGMVG